MSWIPTDVNRKLDAQVLRPRPKPEDTEDQKSTQIIDAKYQEIFYCKGRIKDIIPDNPNKLAPIDLQNALDETMSLGIADPSYKNNA